MGRSCHSRVRQSATIDRVIEHQLVATWDFSRAVVDPVAPKHWIEHLSSSTCDGKFETQPVREEEMLNVCFFFFFQESAH